MAVGTREFSKPSGELSVSLLQGNVPQDEKFSMQHVPQALAWMAHALGKARGELVVAPETAVPLLPEQLVELVPDYWPALRARFETAGQAALIGVPLGDYGSGYTNSVIGLSAASRGGQPYRYDKVHLVPFGEFIPTGFRWFTELMNIPLGDFARGPLNAPSFVVGGERIAPNICYEDLFGDELARRFVDPASAPTIFANLSNIGWFGDTIAVDQHLHISRMRTLEFQRPMLRATNTGATAIIDHRGQVLAHAAALHARRARRQGPGARRADALCLVERALRPVALAAAGRAGDRLEPQRPARTSVPGRAAVSWPSRCTQRPATQVPR